MSEYDVYEDDMPDKGILDRDIELLLSGAFPEDQDLAKLTPIFARTKAAFFFGPLQDEAARFGIEAARVASTSKLTHPVGDVSRPGWSTGSLRRRLAVPAAATAALLAFSGVALAADDSAPGDALYGLDRALEAVGINNGHATERIAEAQALFEDGEIAGAVAHAALAAGESAEAAAAADALLKAAEMLRANENGSANAVETRNRIADMLEWMATTDATGKDFGHGVAERAGGLTSDGSPGDGAPENPGSQGENPPGGGQGNQGQGGKP